MNTGNSCSCITRITTPDHAVLVNGVSILRETDMPAIFTYYHIELARHALVLAEGLAAETFVDNSDRMGFDNWAEHEALFPDGAPMREMDLPRAKSHRQAPRSLRARLLQRGEALYGRPEVAAA